MNKTIWKHTYNTDHFTDDHKKQIKDIWKKSPEDKIMVKGPANKDFVEWIKSEYSKAKLIDDYYSLKEGEVDE